MPSCRLSRAASRHPCLQMVRPPTPGLKKLFKLLDGKMDFTKAYAKCGGEAACTTPKNAKPAYAKYLISKATTS